VSGPYPDGEFWADDAPDSDAAERIDDLLELGRDGPGPVARLMGRRPWLRPAVAIAAAGLIVAGVAVGSHGGRRVPTAAPSRPHHVATATSVPAPAVVSHFADAALAAIRAMATQPGRLQDYVRQNSPAGTCALVAPGHSVRGAVTAAVKRALPDFRVHGFGMVLDEFTGLCAVELRGRNTAGDVLIVSAESPARRGRHTPFSHVQTGFEVSPHSGTKYATVTSPDGFTVLVGATGPMRRLPSDRRLSSLAQDPALTW
jgi:hypothetical protein